jgi:integrase
LEVHEAAPSTIEKLRWLLAKATAAFGEAQLIDLRAEEICAWRGALPEGHRFEARRGVPNPLRRFPEKRPFESWDEIRAVAEHLGPVTGPMALFGAATGLRPAELVALERRDVDRAGRVVHLRRQFVRGQVRPPKTRCSLRPAPLHSVALEALDRLPDAYSVLLFPAPRGGHIDLHNFGAREWRPAQLALGIDPVRRPYDLLRTPRPRRARARGRAPRRLRTRRRRVDVRWTSQRTPKARSPTAFAPSLSR